MQILSSALLNAFEVIVFVWKFVFCWCYDCNCDGADVQTRNSRLKVQLADNVTTLPRWFKSSSLSHPSSPLKNIAKQFYLDYTVRIST